MLRATFLFLSFVSIAPSSPAQTGDPQTRTMEALLSEIRQLRQDLEAAATATRKAQIILYRLLVQELEAKQMELETDLRDRAGQAGSPPGRVGPAGEFTGEFCVTNE